MTGAIRRNTVLLSLCLLTLSGVLQLAVAVATITLVLVTGVESILGFQKQGDALRIDPCIPRHWERFALRYRHGRSHYRIRVENPKGVCRGVSHIELDGAALAGDALIPLADDGREHEAVVVLG